MTAQDLREIDRLIREAESRRPLPWTCTACNTPCDLKLVMQREGGRFRSLCCKAPVRTTKDADAP